MASREFQCEIKDYKSWIFNLNAESPEFLHVMVRTCDLDAALKFYVDGLGMRIIGRLDVSESRATAVYVGFEVGATSIELAYYWDVKEGYSPGSGFGHIAIGVPDVESAVRKLEEIGMQILLRPTILVEGMTRIAHVKDPDGYTIELVQTRNS